MRDSSIRVNVVPQNGHVETRDGRWIYTPQGDDIPAADSFRYTYAGCDRGGWSYSDIGSATFLNGVTAPVEHIVVLGTDKKLQFMNKDTDSGITAHVWRQGAYGTAREGWADADGSYWEYTLAPAWSEPSNLGSVRRISDRFCLLCSSTNKFQSSYFFRIVDVVVQVQRDTTAEVGDEGGDALAHLLKNVVIGSIGPLSSIENIPGIGPSMKRFLAKKGVHTVEQLWMFRERNGSPRKASLELSAELRVAMHGLQGSHDAQLQNWRDGLVDEETGKPKKLRKGDGGGTGGLQWKNRRKESGMVQSPQSSKKSMAGLVQFSRKIDTFLDTFVQFDGTLDPNYSWADTRKLCTDARVV